MHDGKQSSAAITYDVWKLQLRKDCEMRSKLAAFDSIGEYALRLLWESGIDPTVAAIVRSAGKPKD